VPSSTLQPTECQDLAFVAAIFFTNTFTEQRLKHACIKTIKTGNSIHPRALASARVK
jgi:hypothetical protein